MIVFENMGNLYFKVPVITDDKLNETKEKCILGAKTTNYYMREISERKYNRLTSNEFYEKKKSIINDSESVDKSLITTICYNFSDKLAYLINDFTYDSTHNDEYIIKENRLLYPLITKFFISGFNFNKELAVEKNESFQFMELVNNDERSLDEVEYFLSSKKEELTEQLLYNHYKDLAEFYYEIYPYISFECVKSYNIKKLKDFKKQVESFDFDPSFVENVLEYTKTAKQNTKVLNLLNKKCLK